MFRPGHRKHWCYAMEDFFVTAGSGFQVLDLWFRDGEVCSHAKEFVYWLEAVRLQRSVSVFLQAMEGTDCVSLTQEPVGVS